MLLGKVAEVLFIQVLLLIFYVRTIPLSDDNSNSNLEIESYTVLSGLLNVKKPNFEQFKHFSNSSKDFGTFKFCNSSSKFNFSDSSLMQEIDEMMASIERNLEELFNKTKSKGNAESFFSDSTAESFFNDSDESSDSASGSSPEEKPST